MIASGEVQGSEDQSPRLAAEGKLICGRGHRAGLLELEETLGS